MINLSADTLRRIAPVVSGTRATAQAAIIDAVGATLEATCADYAINAALRASHFLAQACHESDGFCTTQEYASGNAYEGRTDLGNTQPGDGPRFKGRGLFQLTGRANYALYGDVLHLNLVDAPEIAADPKISLLIACEFWKRGGLNDPADRDDIITITRRINGGLNGLADRRACLARAKAALGLESAGTSAETDPAPVLRRGSTGTDVVALQTLLHAFDPGVMADGVFSPATEQAVVRFQTSKGLTADGVVGPATWAALRPGGTG
jgi:putative chitinase